MTDMLDLDDTRWTKLDGGRHEPVDPRDALRCLERGIDVAGTWDELWDALYHQGNVGAASYAAVPHLVRVHVLRDVADWNTWSLIGAIELARSAPQNPAVPPWLLVEYESTWRDVPRLALRDLARSEDPLLTRAALGIVAIARGVRTAGEVLLDCTEDELREWLDER